MQDHNITYRQQYSFCRKPSCRKCRENIGHGPYWYSYQTVNGRTVRTYIGKDLPPGVTAQQISAPSSSPSSAPTSALPTALAFRLSTLGQLRLERHDPVEGWQVVTEQSWRVPQARSLLCCLVCAPNHQLTQQQAYEWLWPKLDTKSAAQNLRRASTALSQALGSAYSKSVSSTLALAGSQRLWIDCEEFERLLSQARMLPDEQKTERTKLLEKAIELYHGDFWPEERTAVWSQERRKGLRRQWISGMLDLANLYLDEQRLTAAMDLLEQLVKTEPANETAVQLFMFVLARQQRRVEAVKVYQSLADLLRNTYQAAPSPQTQSLFQKIQQGHEALYRPLFTVASDPTEANSASKEAGMRPQPENSENAGNAFSMSGNTGESGDTLANIPSNMNPAVHEIYTGRTDQSPLVGRDLELRRLHDLLTQVESIRGKNMAHMGSEQALLQQARQTQHAHCVVLQGEAGIGKTRLAEESAREASLRGWTVIWSRAYQQEQDIPYRLWTAALRSVLTYIPELARQALEFSSIATYQPLRALVPEMQEMLVGASVKSGSEAVAYESLLPEQEELRLREAVYTFFITLSLTAPLLIVLDDIQWTDDSSVEMFGYLTRHMTEHPIALLATCRESKLGTKPALNKLIAHMQREQVVEIIEVQRLSDEHIGALVSYLPTPAIIQVQNHAAGNPFFAEELAYSLQTSATSQASFQANAQEATLILPDTIAAALDQRLDRLSKPCCDLLSKAAVLGGSFDLELIAALETNATSDDDLILDWLDEALFAGILTEEGGRAPAIYHLRHPLLTSHLYNKLTATRRRRLHQRVAKVLSQIHQSHESEEAATIVQHLSLGGSPAHEIAHYADLAAHHAYSLCAYSQAEHYYRLALESLAPDLLISEPTTLLTKPLLPTLSPAKRRDLALLVERLADCTRIVGNFRDAPYFYLCALQLRTTPPPVFATPAQERQEAQIQAMIWGEIAWIRRYTGDTEAAHDCHERGAQVLRQAGITDGPAWASLYHQLSSVYLQEGLHQEALQAELQALELFTACLAQSASNEQTSIPPTRQTRITRTMQGDPVDLGRVHSSLGIVYITLGQLSKALKHLQEALAINDQYKRRRESANVCCNIGYVHLLRAEYTQADACFQRSLRYAAQGGDTPIKSITLSNLGILAGSAGQFTESERFYREALALAEQMNDREYLSLWHAMLGELLQEMGRFPEAATAIRRALSIGRAMPNQPCIGFALIGLANLRMALVENEHATTTEPAQRGLRHAQTDLQRALNLRGLDAEKRTRAQLALAQVSFLLGNLEQARQQGQEARTNARKYELFAILARCQEFLNALPRA
jgi:tetratricopeptide (TPR) repeat protein